MNGLMRISSNSTVSPAQRSIRAAHADPILSASALNATSSQAQRFVRAADDLLSASVDKMQKLARLITGIHIQNGLVSESIKPDEFVSDFLHLGSVTPSQIIALNSAKLESAMTVVREFPGKLTTDPASLSAEEKLKLMNEVREMARRTGDVMKWDGKKAFVKEMRNVGNSGVDMKLLLDVVTKIESWSSKLHDIQTFNFVSANPKSVLKLKFYFEDLSLFSSNLPKALDVLIASADSKPWSKYPTINSTKDALSQVYQLAEIIEKAEKNWQKLGPNPSDQVNFNTFHDKNLKELTATVKTVGDVSSDLNVVQALSVSRGSNSAKPTNFPGFHGGIDDINNLLADLDDVWLAEVVNAERLRSALASLKSQMSLFGSTDKALGVTENLNYFELVKGILKVPSETTDMKTAMDGYYVCSRIFTPNGIPNPADLDPLFNSATELDDKVNSVDSQVQNLLTLLNTESTRELLKKTADLAVPPTDDSKLGGALDALKNSEDVKALSDIIKKAKNINFALIKGDIKTIASRLVTEANLVNTFQTTLVEYPAFFTCLMGIDDKKAQMVADAVLVVGKFRAGIDQKVLGDGEALVNTVLESVDDFKNLTEAMKIHQNQTSPEIESLELLPNPQVYSKVISLATIGVTKMKTALDHEAEADEITERFIGLNDYLKSLDDKNDKDDKGILMKLVYSMWSLEKLYEELKKWRDEIKDTDSKDLNDYSDIFTSALSVSSITDNLGSLSASAKSLSERTTNQTIKEHLDTVSDALKNMSSLDLNFTAYHQALEESTDTLSLLDLFFNNFKNSFIVLPEIPAFSPPWEVPDLPELPTTTIIISDIKTYQPMGYTGASSFGTFLTFLGVVIVFLSGMSGFVIWLKLTDPRKR